MNTSHLYTYLILILFQRVQIPRAFLNTAGPLLEASAAPFIVKDTVYSAGPWILCSRALCAQLVRSIRKLTNIIADAYTSAAGQSLVLLSSGGGVVAGVAGGDVAVVVDVVSSVVGWR